MNTQKELVYAYDQERPTIRRLMKLQEAICQNFLIMKCEMKLFNMEKVMDNDESENT